MDKAYERETEMWNQIFKEYTSVDLRNLNLRQTGLEKASPNLFVIKKFC